MKTPTRAECIRNATHSVAAALEYLSLAHSSANAPELDLENTPARIVKMWVELTEGRRQNPPRMTVFESKHDQMLVLKDLSFTSLCSHHYAPFQGVAHVGYIPDGRIVGISKPARVIDYFAAQPQTQERLTEQVADFLMTKLKPLGVGVIMSATHSCISCRGARKPGSSFVTSVVKGVFLEKSDVRQEFLSIVGASNG